jgi:hypothetical protein
MKSGFFSMALPALASRGLLAPAFRRRASWVLLSSRSCGGSAASASSPKARW